MVQPAQERRGHDSRVFGKATSGGRELIRVGHRLENARSPGWRVGDRDCSGSRITKDSSEMSLVHRDQAIETLPTYRADRSLAGCVRLRHPRGHLQVVPAIGLIA